MAYRRIHQNSWSNGDYDCSKEVIKIIHSFKQKILDNNINYYQYFNRWAKKNIISNYYTKKYNIWGGIKHINSLEANYLQFRFIIKIVKEKIHSAGYKAFEIYEKKYNKNSKTLEFNEEKF